MWSLCVFVVGLQEEEKSEIHSWIAGSCRDDGGEREDFPWITGKCRRFLSWIWEQRSTDGAHRARGRHGVKSIRFTPPALNTFLTVKHLLWCSSHVSDSNERSWSKNELSCDRPSTCLFLLLLPKMHFYLCSQTHHIICPERPLICCLMSSRWFLHVVWLQTLNVIEVLHNKQVGPVDEAEKVFVKYIVNVLLSRCEHKHGSS